MLTQLVWSPHPLVDTAKCWPMIRPDLGSWWVVLADYVKTTYICTTQQLNDYSLPLIPTPPLIMAVNIGEALGCPLPSESLWVGEEGENYNNTTADTWTLARPPISWWGIKVSKNILTCWPAPHDTGPGADWRWWRFWNFTLHPCLSVFYENVDWAHWKICWKIRPGMKLSSIKYKSTQ